MPVIEGADPRWTWWVERWQAGQPIPGDSRQVLPADAVCLLDVPVSKICTAFTKPVDPIIGQAIETWPTLRPGQPRRLDRKTSEHVDLLFCVRAHPEELHQPHHHPGAVPESRGPGC